MGAGAEHDLRTAMRPSAFDPPAIPAAFWERPDVCQALRQRDMSALFRLLRQYLGLSQMRIGTAVGLGQGRMSEVINGIRKIRDVKVFERIADGLDMPDHARALLGMTPRQITASPPRSSTIATSGQDAELLRQITAAGRIDATVVRVLQGETDNIRLLDRRLGAPTVAGKLEAHIGHIETSLRYSLRPGNRQQLALVLADASALAGWQAIDMSRLPRAWAHFERATAAAREAGNPCLLAFAAGEQAYVLLDLHRPTEALAMVRAAYEKTHTAIPHQVRSWLRAAEAEMAAAAGEESACRHALDGAAQEISHGAASEDLPYLALNESHLARWRGNCLVMFGDPQTADDLVAALAAMDDGFTRAEASLRCDLAAALHVRGEKDEAKRHLKKARELAQLTGSARQRRRIRNLSRRIAEAA
jgi:tetratricopeptide (TPR) repeat protein